MLIFIFEVHTGIVADIYSRRLSIIIGYFLIGAGFLLAGSLPIFWTIVLSQALWGLGYTFTSDATQAWISDEIGEVAAEKAFLRGSQVDAIGQILGGPLLGLIGIRFSVQAAIMASGLVLSPVLGLYTRTIRRAVPQLEQTVPLN